MKQLFLKLLIIGSLVTAVVYATSAFFSDTETSSDNLLAAGAIDLKVDNSSYYNGLYNPGTSWLEPADLDDGQGPAEGGAYLFFDFHDLKPGDWGEDTISLRVDTNDAWMCVDVTLTSDDDNGLTEPEELAGDTTGGDGEGELADEVHFVWWADDGDNVLENDEELLPGGPLGVLGVGGTTTVRIADSSGSIFSPSDLSLQGAMIGEQVYYIGKAWCFGDFTLNPVEQDSLGLTAHEGGNGPDVRNTGVVCDGAGLDNTTQTDSMTADIAFYAEQARHNPDFLCVGEPAPSTTPSPSPTACTQADVMLVLDRSGSINSSELANLKTAAKDFVDALGLTPTGVHAGQTSFATTGSLDHHLTDDGVSLKAAIDALTSGGFTNLKEGIDLAVTELANPGDEHDRDDGDSPDKLVIITDGHPNRPLPSSTADEAAADSADAARAAGGEVFVVGVGSNVNTEYLRDEIADDADHYYPVSDYSGLEEVLAGLDLCNGED